MYSYYQTIYKLLSKCVNKENQCGKWVFARRSLWLAVARMFDMFVFACMAVHIRNVITKVQRHRHIAIYSSEDDMTSLQLVLKGEKWNSGARC